ncbi:nucleotide pyrophosphohydrolase [Metabacillus schmidteae]|uniref:nucleotide pyrophosphohydrolase n=1 Tax=Metabacillus schmidteae TaxID=2730405 RepID=UPI00158D4182|nr:nucleotide pyrophosphohydrolase [Metabacillus schmidteae]
MSELKRLTDMVVAFRDERDWQQFHNPKDLALSISLEASELLENFQWKTSEEAVEKNAENIKDELADIVIYSLLFANETGIDLVEAIEQKIQKNNEKYPVEKAYGSKTKYSEY